MEGDLFKPVRTSKMETGLVYFWTATIYKWNHLLTPESRKKIITDSLLYLSQNEKIDVYAFVIMPNHLHLIWKLKALNGKELPHASFLKFTSHAFKKELISTPEKSSEFYVDEANKEFNFWQRDSLAVELYTRKTAFQKLGSIHTNPLAEQWRFCTSPESYLYSSASFYETGVDCFGFLKDIRKEI